MAQTQRREQTPQADEELVERFEGELEGDASKGTVTHAAADGWTEPYRASGKMHSIAD